MMIRWSWVALVAILFGLATPFAYADDGGDDDNGGAVASLTGESLLAQEVGQASEVSESTLTGTCNLIGTSTFAFTVEGEAAGPYPGTFIETGTIVVGPPGMLQPTSFESQFTINSTAGIVNGSKSLTEFDPTSIGVCADVPLSANDALISFAATVSYSATITTPSGSGTDSGESRVNYQDFQHRDTGLNGFSFSETFTSTGPAECEDEDADNQGDCDDQGEDEDDDDD